MGTMLDMGTSNIPNISNTSNQSLGTSLTPKTSWDLRSADVLSMLQQSRSSVLLCVNSRTEPPRMAAAEQAPSPARYGP